MDLVIKNTHFLDRTFQIRFGSIVVEKQKIKRIFYSESEVGTFLAESGFSGGVVDGANLVCIPGLTNAHLHPSKDLYRGLFLGQSLPTILSLIHQQNSQESDEDQYWASLYSYKRMIQMGVTTVGVFTSRYQPDLKAAEASGIRCFITYAVNEKWNGDGVSPQVISDEQAFKRVESFLASDRSERISLSIGTSSELTSSPQFMKDLYEVAKRNEVLFSLHVSEGETQSNKCREVHGLHSVEFLNSLNLLTENTLLIHASFLTPKEVELVANVPVRLVSCPLANAFAQSGLFELLKLNDGKCSIGLGTDAGMINPQNNLMADALFSYFSQRVMSREKQVDFESIFKMITVAGAQALGLERVGVIEEGWEADIAVFSIPDHAPIDEYNPLLLISEILMTSLARYVVIGGELVIDDYEFKRMDEGFLNQKFYGIKSRLATPLMEHLQAFEAGE
ncbi:amidohydrolase family protein [Thermoactinomyces sp. DSM 45892]|uniref:amidohydrolase family protein n=1 Tax=Thermoactinomyces sp. DSM 45892 TaxID=1882753 RepID=UPI000895CE81|nr:amidohydrolase family protein [Thermoactinomyces sp. DSM 45892]SDY39585.1 5-methylthioadenosine/S-adenosylhomocysteine deaminase [Thermoactinomyces sp. DSM 45892]